MSEMSEGLHADEIPAEVGQRAKNLKHIADLKLQRGMEVDCHGMIVRIKEINRENGTVSFHMTEKPVKGGKLNIVPAIELKPLPTRSRIKTH